MKFEIKNRWNGSVIFSLETTSFKLCVEAAYKSGADLRGADLRGANLRGADLQGADLRGANLRGADLQGADLRWADLRCTDLQGADLQGADLRWADLRCTDLQGADLQGADLQGADLQGADLRGAYLQGAKYGENIPLENEPLQIIGTKYFILIMDAHIKIGCKLYSHKEWENFSDYEISKMDSGALEWWKEWKGFVLSMSLGHQQRIAKK